MANQKYLDALDKRIDSLTQAIENFDKSMSAGGKLKDYFSGGAYSKLNSKESEIDNLDKELKRLTDQLKNANDERKKELNKEIELNKQQKKLAEKEKTEIGKSGKAAVVSKITGEITKAVKDYSAAIVKLNQLEIENKKIHLEASKKTAKLQLDLIGNIAKQSLSIGTTGILNTIQENSFQAAQNAIQIGKEYMMANVDISRIEFDKYVDLNMNRIKQMTASIGAVADSASGALSSIPNPWTQAIGAVISTANTIFQATKEVEIMKEQYKKDIYDAVNEFQKKAIEQAGEIVGNFTKLAEGTDKLLMELDTEAHNASRRFGLSEQQTENYVKTVAELNKEMAVVGKSFADLSKMQASYISESGRAHMMSGREGQMMSSFAKLYNISDEESAQIMGAMNIFNTSIESGSDMMFEMYQMANQMGVSNEKFAKDMAKNLKLAEKYQFKGGVAGMMKMSLWAQKVRFSMESLSSALEKMHTGNIEDVIQTSAKLNVLGGNAAVYSDPMAMLYNAYADPAQYMKNLQKMIQGYGQFNKKTGETDFSINELMRIEAIAAATGVSKEEFMNAARQENKLNRIKGVLGGRFGEEETDFITNNATYNKKTGKWEVNVMGSNGHVTSHEVDTLSATDLERIFPKDSQKQLVGYTQGIYSILEKNLGTEMGYRSELMQRTQEAHREEYGKRNETSKDYYYGNMGSLEDEVKRNFEFTTDMLYEQFKISSDALNNEVEGKTISERYYEITKQGYLDMGKKMDTFNLIMAGVHDNDNAKIISGIASIDKRLAAEFKQVLDEDAAREMVNTFIKDGTVSKDEWKQISADKTMYKQFMQSYGVKGLSNAQQKELMDTGQMKLENGFLITPDGRYYPMEEGAVNALEQNRVGEKTGKWATREMKVSYLQALANPWNTVSDYLPEWLRHTERLLAGDTMGNIRHGISSLKKANDMVISPKHGIFDLNPDDTTAIIASKPGGSIDRSSQKKNSTTDNINLTVNGSLTLNSNSQKIDLMELLRNDPNGLRELTKSILIEASRTNNGVNPEWAPNRFTIK